MPRRRRYRHYKRAKRHGRFLVMPRGMGRSSQMYRANNTRRLRLKFVFEHSLTLEPNAGAPIALQVTAYYPLNFPGYFTYDNGAQGGAASNPYGLISAAATVGGFAPAIYNGGNFFGANALFDEYRVKGLRVRILMNEIQVNTNAGINGGAAAPSKNSMTVWRYNDLDDCTYIQASDIQQWMDMGNLPVTIDNTSRKGVNFKFAQPREKRKFWLNTANIGQTQAGNVTGQNALFPDPFGSMKLLFEGLVASSTVNQTTYGKIYLCYDVEFRGIGSLF